MLFIIRKTLLLLWCNQRPFGKAILYQNEAFKVSGNGRMIIGEEARRAYFEEENPYHLSALLKQYGHPEWVDEQYDMFSMEDGQ